MGQSLNTSPRATHDWRSPAIKILHVFQLIDPVLHFGPETARSEYQFSSVSRLTVAELVVHPAAWRLPRW